MSSSLALFIALYLLNLPFRFLKKRRRGEQVAISTAHKCWIGLLVLYLLWFLFPMHLANSQASVTAVFAQGETLEATALSQAEALLSDALFLRKMRFRGLSQESLTNSFIIWIHKNQLTPIQAYLGIPREATMIVVTRNAVYAVKTTQEYRFLGKPEELYDALVAIAAQT